MKVHNSTDSFKISKPALTVGTFDGVHLGHLKILEELIETAKNINGESVVLTLHPHPRKVLFPNSKIQILNTIEEKAELLEKIGIDRFIIYPFTKEFSNFTSCDFIEKILHNKLNIKQLTVGYDHHFGKDKQNDFNVLKRCTNKFNILIRKVDALQKNNLNISSTQIRNYLSETEIEKANSFLGYEYFISGTVVSGSKIGRTIGFPTANILTDSDKLVPATGVYAVKVIVLGKEYVGMLNIGAKPTVSDKKQNTIEVHIFDFNENIYQKHIKIIFKKFIRKEKKFLNTEDLKNQLIKDKIYIQNL